MKYSIAILALALASGGARAHADNTSSPQNNTTEWAIDAAHTHVGFSVPHMVVSEVEGEFKTFSGKVLLDEKDLTKSKVELTVQVASIDTGVADRDKHLRSGDFFEADKHPTITFKSTKITKAGKGFKITGKLNRLDYGVSWNKSLDKGGIAVGNDVTIEVKTEINK